MAILAVAACAPARTAEPLPATPAQPTAGLSATAIPSPTFASTLPPATVTETVSPTPLPVATSRGPDLEASDPAAVSLASGGVQFVEFFRFT